jgi:hypothetical protein
VTKIKRCCLPLLLRFTGLPSRRSKLSSRIRATVSRHHLLLLIADNSSLGRLLDRQGCGRRLLGVLNRPVENVVVLESFSNEQISEQFSQVRVVGFVVESQRPAVVEVYRKLIGVTSAQDLGGSRHLLLHDSVILLLLGGSLQSLPRQRTSKEVHEYVAEGFEVVSSRLLNTEMCVDRGVTSGTGQVLVLSVRNVQVSLGVPVLLRQSEIDHVDLVASLADTHQKVVRLDVPVDKVSRVNVFDPRNL